MVDTKKAFEAPEIDVIVMSVEDIVTASSVDDWETPDMPV